MSRKKWPRVWVKHHIDELGRHAPTVSSWEGDAFPVGGDIYLSVTEHQAILSEEQRLNAMGQERELALMARVKELEKMLAAAKEALKIIEGTYFVQGTSVKLLCTEALATIDNQ